MKYETIATVMIIRAAAEESNGLTIILHFTDDGAATGHRPELSRDTGMFCYFPAKSLRLFRINI